MFYFAKKAVLTLQKIAVKIRNLKSVFSELTGFFPDNKFLIMHMSDLRVFNKENIIG